MDTDFPLADLNVSPQMIQDFITASPFPHTVIDNFIDTTALKQVEDELRNMPLELWLKKRDPTSGEMIQQQKKLAIKDATVLGPHSRRMMEYFSSAEMIKYLEQLTGIAGLQSDPTFLGGGVHRTEKDGKLSIHADFNMHPETRKHRRLNVLLYMNSKCKPEDEGKLELWDTKMTKCEKMIDPIFNRMVVFRITDDAYHGHPEPWVGNEFRLSMAFYYYTDNRPENEKTPFHWATWQPRPDKGW